MSTKLLDLVNITKSYDGVTILDDLNLYIRENEFLTLLGPSGCGKTTTLLILGGFETPDAGKVLFNGQDITQLPPNKRQLNTVFQFRYSRSADACSSLALCFSRICDTAENIVQISIKIIYLFISLHHHNSHQHNQKADDIFYRQIFMKNEHGPDLGPDQIDAAVCICG